ncbi:MAG: hypothetical protein PVG83_10040 [Acidimicrobiia bacterium]|jgi:hypothetical protein
MKKAFALTLASVVFVSCGEPGTSEPEVATPEIMTVALTQLVTVDNTFGGGPPPFTEYLIQTRTDPRAGDVTGGSGEPSRELTGAERAAIEEALAEYGPVRWIDDPDEWRTPDLMPQIEGSVILGIGEPVVEDGSALVPVSLWCGGLCGTWLSYRVDLVDGLWEVSGIEGPVAVS